MLEQFSFFGRELFLQGVNSSHSGNMSVRVGDRIFITRRGSMLSHLKEGDLVETGLQDDDSHITLASTEIKIHRAIYRETSALAVVHAHPPCAVALSLLEDEIRPVDTEGIYYFKVVPVLGADLTVGSDEVAEKLPLLLQNYKIAMVRGHGSFAVGQMLEEAFQWTSSLEASCRALLFYRLLSPQPKREGKVRW
ncbi:aldolase [Candidatus Solincola tengchongensis]|uniref:aldolase n=1 Tax=Candidatus Solincola tengchongensis TaxID=2900693 RepID=UPI00257AEAC5|nr:aldolase [Candidatus Solincola tengchongensis]